ncbi:PREDICTED: uncharacterized protein LOC105558290 [Vollenhovia emeryi]|uniref:uncharacterized protein LOC105558290 n=1 Tax=Vollenhovia emeryi TaxID=411798 RepID=UPI0005F4BA99|nr:PREDICTED: uncharacterized protein LOC105558290 [Vollenhovia emeryi]
MAVRHYAHQYTVQLTDEKITGGNVSSENSDAEDYYPLIHRSANGTMVNADARAKEADETKLCDQRTKPLTTTIFSSFLASTTNPVDKFHSGREPRIRILQKITR